MGVLQKLCPSQMAELEKWSCLILVELAGSEGIPMPDTDKIQIYTVGFGFCFDWIVSMP